MVKYSVYKTNAWFSFIVIFFLFFFLLPVDFEDQMNGKEFDREELGITWGQQNLI